MLIANKIAKGGLWRDTFFEVTASGSPIATINDTKSTFELDRQSFAIASTRLGKVHLKCGDTLIATAVQKPLRNHYTLSLGGKEWTFKATVLLATKFGVFENETQKGAIAAGPWFNRVKDITADLPDELPRPIQMFLLSIFIGKLTEPNN
jgi:hypothetical protein